MKIVNGFDANDCFETILLECFPEKSNQNDQLDRITQILYEEPFASCIASLNIIKDANLFQIIKKIIGPLLESTSPQKHVDLSQSNMSYGQISKIHPISNQFYRVLAMLQKRLLSIVCLAIVLSSYEGFRHLNL